MRVLRLIEKPVWVVLATLRVKAGIPFLDSPAEEKEVGMPARRLYSRTSLRRRWEF